MILSLKVVTCVLVLGLTSLAWSLPIPRMIDMSYSYFNLTPTYPGHTKFQVINPRQVWLSETVKFKTEEIMTSEHAGTHMDAPDHFVDNSWTIDEIPVEHFEGPCVVVNITERASQVEDAAVSVQDLQDWEKQYGRIPSKSIVLMNSGWGQFWQNETAYFGSNDIKKLHFPGFSGEACQWLVTERDIVGIGGDTVSCDVGNSLDFPCHHHILKANGYVLENVANVDQLPPSGATLRAYPMKIKDGTGAPTRIVAILPNE